MKRLGMITLISAFFLFNGCATGGVPDFGAQIGAIVSPVPGIADVRLPYKVLINYYGYVKEGAKADYTYDGKKFYYLYVWIPAIAPEIGIRMMSPVPAGFAPTAKDYVSATWESGKSDTENYFDTWIAWERALEVINPEDIASKGTSTKWFLFDANDDSSELPANPSGSRYNSVLRIVSGEGGPLKALVRGLYRIGFTTYKSGDVKGTFLAQVGFPIDLPGVVVAPSLEELSQKVKESKTE